MEAIKKKWYLVTYHVPGERTMFPLIEKLCCNANDNPKDIFLLIYPNRVVDYYNRIPEYEVELYNLLGVSMIERDDEKGFTS